jgi:cellobiose-specific phosphotransferase system component IIB
VPGRIREEATMATIVLVCAAGVSGTFLARRLASSLPDVRFTVATEHALAESLAGTDAVLLAPQVAGSLDRIRAAVSPRPVGVLTPEALTPAGVLIAVDAVEDLLDSLPQPSAPIGAPVTEKEIADA